MKKRGFTLAEVLITLAIIGIVATMTLPALMNNSAEQQAKTGLKKGINTLTEAAATEQALNGVDYSTFTSLTAPDSATLEENPNTFFAILNNRVSVDFNRLNVTATAREGGLDANYYEVPFRDGTSVLYEESGTVDTTVAADGLPVGFVVIYDTNGAKQPNIMSNCQGTSGGALETQTLAEEDEDATELNLDVAACNSKTDRVIRDRFALRLRGTSVVPEGPAATWAYNN
ncbi:type II secretion system protein [bacterium]|nr:type II secretion system protein [bacterium]